jgi:FecR protein
MSSRSIFQRHGIVLFALLLLSAVGVSVALADDADPPGRAARLSLTKGAVSLQPAGVQDWTDAAVNRPLTTGDKLWADQDSRAEIDIGSAVIRLGSMTGFSFLNLDDQTAQMNVTAGTAIVHVRGLGDNQAIEIDTPNLAVTVQSPGDYRIEVNDSGDTTVVKVSDGDAQVTATGQTVPMHTQQAYTFTGTDQVSVDTGSVGAPDVLDQWSLDRDHHEEQAQVESNQYVAPDVEGAEDLGDYGTWQDTPDYGPVWTPTAVAADWSPYHYGRWVWVAPWGWTWVDDAPWGFAPFHYGRWTYLGSRWGWVPGPRRVRPVYAPALVAWVGSPVAGITIAGGVGAGVAWFPLGPREVFVPGYHVSNNYVRNVNISNTNIVNTTYITNVYENRVSNVAYVNRNRPGAVVAVSQSVFTSAQPIRGHTMRVSAGELAQMGAHGAAPAIAPVRDSVLGRGTNVNVRRPPAAFVNRPVVARIAPPPAPVAFERQQEAIRANGNRPLARSQVTELQPRAANSQVRVVTPGPLRPLQNSGSRLGADRPVQGRDQQSIQERERALHATPIPPSPGAQSAPHYDRPAAADVHPAPTVNGAFRNDRPPQNQQRQNDMYRMQDNDASRRQAQEVRPTPEAHPMPQAHPLPQAYPVEPSRAVEPPHPVEQPRPPTAPVDASRLHAEPRTVEPPHPAPPPQHADEHRGKPAPDHPEPRLNRL